MAEYSTCILAVDDERYFRELTQQVLTAAGLECLTASNAAEALELVEEPRIGVVVLDVVLPGIDGIEVLRRVRETRPEVRVIMLSAHTEQDRVLDALRLGAFDYVAKPIHEEEFVLTVRRAVEVFETELGAERLRARLRTLESRMVALSGVAYADHPEKAIDALHTGTAEAVADVLGAGKSSVMVVDDEGGQLRVAAAIGRKLRVEEFDPVPVGEGVAGRAFARRESILVADIGTDARFAQPTAEGRYATGSFVVAPIVAGDRSLGVLCAADRCDQPFDAEDESLLRILAQNAAQYLGDSRSGSQQDDSSSEVRSDEDSGANREMDAQLARAVCEAVTAEVEPARLFDAALKPVAESLGAHSVAIYLCDAVSGALVREGHCGVGGRSDRVQLAPGVGLTGAVIETGEAVLSEQPELDSRFDPGVDTDESGTVAPLLCFPLVFRGKTLGVCRVFPSEVGRLTAGCVELLGAALSAAVRNVLLYRSLVASIEEVAQVRRASRLRPG